MKMAVNNVCRLCMSGEELIWVYDKTLTSSDNLGEVILITTGVEILEKDIISQKICKNCHSVTAKIYSFRRRAEETDKYLKVKCKELLKSSEITIKIPNTSVSIKTDKRCIKDVTNSKNSSSSSSVVPKISITKNIELPVKTDTETELYNKISIQPSETEINPISTTKEIPKSTKKKVHSSIDEIFATYENIKIPSACLPLDLNPSVCMEMDDVENYFRLNNLDMTKAVQTVLKSLRVTKKTAAINKYTPSSANVEENKTDLINEERRVSPISIKTTAKDKSHYLINEERRVSPISIKATTEDKSHFTVIAKNSVKRKIDDSDSDDIPKNKTNKSKLKRKHSSSDLFVENEVQQPSFFESLALKPKDVFVYRCNICRCPQFNAKSLRDHLKEHFKCRFCRTKFKIVDQKENHQKACKHKQRLTSTPYVILERVDNLLKQLTQSPIVGNKKADETTSTENIYQGSDKNQQGVQRDEVIELSDDDDDENNLNRHVPSTSASTPSLLVVNDVKSNGNIPSNVPVPTMISLLSVDNISMVQPLQYISTGIVKPAIQIKDNSMLNSIDTSAPDFKVLKELLTNTMPVHMKLCVDGESQTSLPSNDRIIKNTSTDTAELKDFLRELYVYKVPIDIQKGDFNITYSKPKTPEKKKMQTWNKTNAIDIKSPKFTYFNTNNLNKHIAQGISLLQPVSQTPHVPQPIVLNSTIAGIPLGQQNFQSKNQNSQPLHFSEAPVNLNQNVPQNTIYGTYNSQSVSSNLYTQGPTTCFNSNPLQLVADSVNPNLSNNMTYVMQNTTSNSNIHGYVNASANITTGNNMYPPNNPQNLNLSITCTNALDPNQSMPLSSLTDSFVSNNVVFSTVPNIQSHVSSIPDAILPSNTLDNSNVNNSLNTLAPTGYNVSAGSNAGVHNYFTSSSINQAAVSSVSTASNVEQMPLIRVRNICELK